MGTTYGIHPDGTDDAEIVLDEMSNTLCVGVFDGVEAYNYSDRMSPEQALSMAERIVQVCLYWVENPEAVKADFIERVSKLSN